MQGETNIFEGGLVFDTNGFKVKAVELYGLMFIALLLVLRAIKDLF